MYGNNSVWIDTESLPVIISGGWDYKGPSFPMTYISELKKKMTKEGWYLKICNYEKKILWASWMGVHLGVLFI